MKYKGIFLSQAAFAIIADVMRSETGVELASAKIDMVRSRLSRRVRFLGLNDFDAYCEIIKSKTAILERRELVSALTTNVTSYFREPHHFYHFGKKIVPRLASDSRSEQPIRIWSAGCSSGEEAFSIAYSVFLVAPEMLFSDFRILATDIDYKVLERAKSNNPPLSLLSHMKSKYGLSGENLARRIDTPQHDTQTGHVSKGAVKFGNRANQRHQCKNSSADRLNDAEISDIIKKSITFKTMNLNSEWGVKGNFQAIFCRNVLIYFGSKSKREIICNFSKHTEAGSALYLGHAERVDDDLSHLFEKDGVTTYIRK